MVSLRKSLKALGTKRTRMTQIGQLRKLVYTLILALGGTQLYACNTDSGLNTSKVENNTPKQDPMKLKIIVGDNVLTATLIDNVTTRTFMELLPLTIKMTELHNNEKYGILPKRLPGKAVRPGTIHAGDLMLWDSDYKCLVLFYKTFSSPYHYVKLGTVDNLDELEAALGTGDVTITFEQLKK